MFCSYNILAPVTYGAGATAETGNVCVSLGAKKVLVVTEQNLVNLGLVKKVTDSLEGTGIEYQVFAECVQDTPDYVVDAGGKAAKAMGADMIVGVGGGSSLDTAKAIAVLVGANITIDELLIPGPPRRNPQLPTVLVPTTSGTGSESTQIGVVNDTKRSCKTGVGAVPSAAIVDPELTVGLPRGITVYTGLDAFSHAVEVLCSGGMDNPHSDLLAYDAIDRIIKWLPVAVEDIYNLEARENLAIASNFAGAAFADAIVNLGHGMAHAIGAHFHIPHGIACAWATPVVLEFMAPVCGEKYRRVAHSMGLDTTGKTGEEVGLMCAQWQKEFIKKLGVPSAQSFNITKEDLVSCADYMINIEVITMLGKRAPSNEEVVEVLEKAYEVASSL